MSKKSLCAQLCQRDSGTADWSPEATDLIRQSFQADELAGTDVLDVQCRATRCRVEVAHADPADRQAFQFRFPAMVSAMLPRATFNQIRDEDGQGSMVIYLDREI